VFFFNASSPKPHSIYRIRTNWILHYPAQIQEGLRNEGFEVVDKSLLYVNTTNCGWSRLHSYWGAGVRRGYMDVSWTATEPYRDPDIVHRVQEILQVQYPHVEIVLLVGILVYPVLLYVGLRIRGRKEKSKRKSPSKDMSTSPPKVMISHSHTTENAQRVPIFTPPLLNLAAELQLEIVSHLDFHDVRRLRATCRFYQSLITDALLEELRVAHVERLNKLENDKANAGPGTSDQAICFSCLRVKPKNMFTNDQLSARQRSCIPCGVKAGHWIRYGAALNVGGQTTWVCAHCKRLVSAARLCSNTRKYLCKNCSPRLHIEEDGSSLRCLQFVFGVILFAVACSGRGRYSLSEALAKVC
jgi:hypothetical protein